ncbi:two component regulator with propeller domain [Mucilaginibacter yixingensis]|uniref:histidine kinase n=1 Tax=Mucilaginibacter yixingensis TaxID=1295612 RepID=A0A2T5J654_9SPHI|nr:two-component regulator propeller domain-containing protein [Mucilaginibacter yixingensis]PTQ94014.1 two component regulator with propeller domain [Mucilaginibacter yixingensis]
MNGVVKIIATLLVWLCLAQPVSAQLKCKVEHYTTEDGLSHDRLTGIIKDHDGFIWAGSWDGINRYDGRSFVLYKSFPGDSSKLVNDRIVGILDDRKDKLWLKGSQNEVYLFNKRNEQFYPINTVIPGFDARKIEVKSMIFVKEGLVALTTKKNGVFFVFTTQNQPKVIACSRTGKAAIKLPSDTVNFVFQDKLKHIWIGTNHGLVVAKATGNGLTLIYPLTHYPGLNYTDFSEGSNELYLGTAQGYLIRINQKNGAAQPIKITEGAITALHKASNGSVVYCATNNGKLVQFQPNSLNTTTDLICKNEPLRSIHEDRSGALWLEPESRGIIRYLPNSRTWKWHTSPTDGTNNGTKFHNWFEDNAGRIWVNMKGGGFGFYNTSKNAIDCNYQDDEQEATARFPEIVYDVCYDDAGIIWLSTAKGLIKIIPQNLNIRLEPVDPNTNELQSNEVRGLTTDSRGRVWVGTRNGHILIYQNGKPINTQFIGLPTKGFGSIYAICEDHQGVVWIGTYNNGLFKATPTLPGAGQYQINHCADVTGADALKGRKITTLFEDASQRLWAGTYGDGLYEIIDNGPSIKTIGINYRNHTEHSRFGKIRHIAKDNLNNLWLATTDGVVVLNLKSHLAAPDNIVIYSKVVGSPVGLSDNDVLYVYKDHNNNMWLATAGGGICRATTNNPFKGVSFKNYTKHDGFSSDYVLSICEDKARNLWLATQNGLSKFNPTNESVRNYTSRDGVFRPAFSESSITNQPDGMIIVGSTKGLAWFDPAKWADSQVNTRIAFTNLQINNTDVATGASNNILAHNIDYSKSIELRHYENTVSLDFALLDYLHGNDQNLLYRLAGYNDKWQNSGGQRRVTYTNLPPGNYRFEIKTANNRLYANHVYRSINISVKPPFWKTWWAYLMYTAALCWLILTIVKTVKTILKLKQSVAIERKVAALKLDFFTNVSHELRTPLTLILNPLQELMDKENFSAKGKSYIQLIYRNAERLTRFMNQWLDLRKIQSGKGELNYQKVEILTFIREIAGHLIHPGNDKRIALTINASFDEMEVVVDPEKFDVLIYNIIANAVKFSPEQGNITINVSMPDDAGNFSISISDEGIGISEDKLKDIFKLYFTDSRKDAQHITGTGIGLALSKEIVEMHGGQIYAQANHPHGLSIVISLPLGLDIDKCMPPSPSTYPQQIPHVLQAVEYIDTQHIENPPGAGFPVLLLVEDNHDLRDFLSMQLGDYYQVATAQNGKIGLQMAIDLMPDIIVSDVMMPLMTGIEMLDKIKTTDATSHIPVILLSAKSSVESQIEGLRYGADYYLNKPFHKELLLTVITTLIKQRKQLFDGLVKDRIVDLKPGQVAITSKDELFLRQVINIVESGMCDPEFNVEMVADALSMARTTFYKKFKSLTDVSMSDFIRDMRLERAKQLIDAGENRISTVAYSVGFNNPKYFSTCFREKFAISPTDYLKSLHAA